MFTFKKDKQLNKIQQKIFNFIWLGEYVSVKEIANGLNISEDEVKKEIDKLKLKGVLE